MKCDASVGFNRSFGAQHCKVYSEKDRALAGLMREIQLLGNLHAWMSWTLVYFVSTAYIAHCITI